MQTFQTMHTKAPGSISSPKSGQGHGGGAWTGQSQTCRLPFSQAILPLMKFLEVKLCYMNTNLVQENFNRSVGATCPAVPHCLYLSSAHPSFPDSVSILWGGCNHPVLAHTPSEPLPKSSLAGIGSSVPHISS